VLTIETWLKSIELDEPIEECPAWPPDLFALAGTLIRRSGAYLRVFERRDRAEYAAEIATEAGEWRKELDKISVQAEDVGPKELKAALTQKIKDRWARLIQPARFARPRPTSRRMTNS
jgi:hypothetical protein